MDEHPSPDEKYTLSIGNDFMWGNRASAVQAYANLEQALCRLFHFCAVFR
jgi:hypothetical protein